MANRVDKFKMLFDAVSNNDIRKTRSLLRQKVSPNFYLKTELSPIHNATSCEMISLLIEYTCDINAQTKTKQLTLLHIQTYWNNVLLVKHLLKNGAKKHLRDYKNQTALDYAKSSHHSELISLLS